MPPVIGITADSKSEKVAGNRPKEIFFAKSAVVEAVLKAGGIPLIIPNCADSATARDCIKSLAGLLIAGGDFDINPSYYGERRRKEVQAFNNARTVSELHLLKAALRAKKPVLGICGGLQLINVYFGGRLYQHIPVQLEGALDHVQRPSPLKPSHSVKINKGTKLASIIGERGLNVNSTHHQSVKEPGRGLSVSAVAKDGVVEALESTDRRYIIGLQWHPEYLTKSVRQMKIFGSFIAATRQAVARRG